MNISILIFKDIFKNALTQSNYICNTKTQMEENSTDSYRAIINLFRRVVCLASSDGLEIYIYIYIYIYIWGRVYCIRNTFSGLRQQPAD